MTGPLGNSEFCFPRDQSLSVKYCPLSLDDASHKLQISCVCPLIDNENWPMSEREFLQLL